MREGVEIPPRAPITRGRDRVPDRCWRSWWTRAGALASRARAGITGSCGVAGAAVIRLRRGAARRRRYRVVPALARAIGVLVTWRGITGRLARENSIRQPGRTLVTAAALTVGLALVTFVAVLADGTKATIDQAVGRSFAGDLIVENSQVGKANRASRRSSRRRCAGCRGSPASRRSPSRVGRLHGISRQRDDHRDRTEHVRAGLPDRLEARLERDAAGTRRHGDGPDQGLRRKHTT